MLYVLLTIIAILLYEIYKLQKPKKSKEQTAEDIQTEIAESEEMLLDNIKTTHLKDYMQTEKALFECGKKNFIRLNERFKHDDIKHKQVIKDWQDYIATLDDIVYEHNMLDVCESGDTDLHWDKRDELYIKIQEIDKRFKDLLGNEYINPSEEIDEKRDA